MKNALLFIVFIASIQPFATAQQHTIELSTALVGNIHYSRYKSIKPMSEFGANYQRRMFEQTYVVFNIQGVGWKFKDNLIDSFNSINGSINYRQLMGSVGVRHLFKQEIAGELNYFGECSFHYNGLNSEQVYFNGLSQDTLAHTYKRFKGVGFGFKAGLIYQSYSTWYLGCNLSVLMSGGKDGTAKHEEIKDLELKRPVEDLTDNQSLARFPLEIRFGYRF